MNCVICQGNVKQIPLIHEVSRYTRTAYPLFECTNCGLARPHPLPYSETTKLSIYDVPENIRFFNKETKTIEESSPEYKYYFRHFTPYIDLVNKYNIQGSCLDVGCGVGHLMHMLARKGLNVEGMEISPDLVSALNKKFKVYCAEVGDKSIKKKYDLITFNHVLEHVEHPESFIKGIYSMLNEQGYIIFAVPFLYGLIPQILRTKWYGLGYGQHLNFFSIKSLKNLLERNGFIVHEFKRLSVDYAHPAFPRIMNTVAQMIMKGVIAMNWGDNLFVVAQRNGK
ncbi:class I SAM-dependent methyltransferase [Candidatus Pacearchaeota archaeon]|nr:class I SAM-dependent methyltransferase [Candidatus Pacearchaeota archaeon]